MNPLFRLSVTQKLHPWSLQKQPPRRCQSQPPLPRGKAEGEAVWTWCLCLPDPQKWEIQAGMLPTESSLRLVMNLTQGNTEAAFITLWNTEG